MWISGYQLSCAIAFTQIASTYPHIPASHHDIDLFHEIGPMRPNSS
jgi:hypothetical protein